MENNEKVKNESVPSKEIKQFIIISLGAEQYGINIQYIQNIVRMIPITRVPQAPKYIKGVANLRGEIIPVMSLRIKFGLEEEKKTDDNRIIFLEVNNNDIGIIVDEVDEVVTLKDTDIDFIINEANCEKDNYVFGVGKVEDTLVTLLNIEELARIEATKKS